MSDYNEHIVELPFGYLMDQCNDWLDFCNDAGLNPYVLKEGLASSDDTYGCSVALLKKHGILVGSDS